MTELYYPPVAKVLEDDGGDTRIVQYANGNIGEQHCSIDENDNEEWLDEYDEFGRVSYPPDQYPPSGDDEDW